MFAFIKYAFAEANCLWSYQQQNTEYANFHDMQTHARTASSSMFLFVMIKTYAITEDNFHENEGIQESNGLKV